MGQPLSLNFHYTKSHNEIITHHTAYSYMRGGYESIGCCGTFRKETIRKKIDQTGSCCKWPTIYINNFVEVILTIVMTMIVTVITIIPFVLAFIFGILSGLTSFIEFNCCECNLFAFMGLGCLGITTVGMTNRRVTIVCFATVYSIFISYMYLPIYIVLNVLQILSPYIMLALVKYDLWFTEKPSSQPNVNQSEV